MEWEAIRSFFVNQGPQKLVEHQIESYEDFIRNKLPLIVSSTAPIVIWHEQDDVTKKYKYEFRLSFENITYMKPRIQEATGRVKPMFPQEARLRNFTYAAQMFADVRFITRAYYGEKLDKYIEQYRIFEGISLGKIPVMLGSSLCIMKDYPMSYEELGECPNDPFGYFIIHGSERTILCQEKVADNRIMVFAAKKTAAKYTHCVELKSLHESFTMPPKKLEIRLNTKFNGFGLPLTACFPRFREDIPVMVLFRALGLEGDEDIVKMIWGSNVEQYESLTASFRECSDIKVYSRADAIEYLSHHLQYATNMEDKKEYVRILLETELLPHVKFGGDTSNQKTLEARKCIMISLMIKRLILTSQGKIRLDDRDAYPNKRVVTTGALLTHLFRQLFQKVCKDIRGKFVHEVNNDTWKKGDKPRPLEVLNINNLYKILKVSTIEGKLKQALATGNFTVQGVGPSNNGSNATKVGVSQVLNRLSYLATVSHLRRIQTPVEKSGKLLAPRKLHGTSFGYVCPVETPEGHSVGIVKSMSMMTSISQHTPSIVVMNILNIPDVHWINGFNFNRTEISITVNGVIVAHTQKPYLVFKLLKEAKKNFILHPHSSIVWSVTHQTIEIETDGGRIVRPLFRVENGKIIDKPSSTNWDDWVKTNIEYIDSAESDTIQVAMMPNEITNHHTHCEIHPSLMLGHMASTIPMSDHNQSPRNTYQSAMGKQAMGLYAKNYAKRLDKNGYVLCSPMRPFVETRMMNVMKIQEMPFGYNAIVAIGIYSGYNQEDSVILNKGALDRGLFRSLYYTVYKDEEHRNVASGKEEKFSKPKRENTRGYKNSSYHAIQENGMPAVNSIIQENDIVIGKVTNLKSDVHGYAFRDSSTTHKGAEACRVDGVWQDKNSDGYPFIKVRAVSERVPEIGDKVSSRHGQKGTCGIILNEEDMPFTSSGLRPDIIMNPHAVPSRMTIAQLMETMFGKICTEKGAMGDGTPYSHLTIEELRKQMVELGMHPYGNELLYNGQTGEMMEAEIFMGPTFYQRLKHMVSDKVHSRNKGPIVSLTRQPCEGRSREGGLRVGEMERDCMLSHGTSMFTKERLMDVSDPFKTGFCKNCGVLAVVNKEASLYDCGTCGVQTEFEMKTIPYAMKLWSQELEAMHIVPRLVFE
jgi:DNA-directed RNA polymerase II subunit RPB2